MLSVFKFTFAQNTKGKGFVFVTFILPVIICMIFVVAGILTASIDEDDYTFPSEKVYIKNESSLKYMDFSEFAQFAGDDYAGIEFIVDGKDINADPLALEATIKENDDEYSVNVNVPEISMLSHDEAEEFNSILAAYIEKIKVINAVMESHDDKASQSDILTALMPVNVNRTIIGDENAGFGADLIKFLLPMFTVLIIYFLVLLYGQTIGQTIVSEKVSKLMETLLVTVKPYQLIAGKILAMVTIAVIQVVMWVIGIVVGLNLGDIVARSINPDYSNVIFNAMDLIKEAAEGMAFSAPAVILGVIALIVGFIFYCALAGLFASPVSKAEELSTSTGIFQTVVVFSFLAAYMIPLQMDGELGILGVVLRIIPLTSSFMLTGDIVIGNISIPEAFGYIALLAVFTAGLSFYAGKLYKNQVFYNNTSNSFFKRLFK